MIQIDPRSAAPIYEQIIEQLKILCLKGVMKPGDKLPSVRACHHYYCESKHRQQSV